MTDQDALDAAIKRLLIGAQKDAKPRVDPVDRFRNWLAGILVFAFVGTLPLLLWKDIPEKNKDTITYILGQISGMALTVTGFYFVSKVTDAALDKQRVENTAKFADAINATAAANTPPPVTVAPKATSVTIDGEQP